MSHYAKQVKLSLMTHEHELKTVAQRLVSLRKVTRLSRSGLAEKHALKLPSLRGWETGQRIPGRKKAEILVAVFNQQGIPCTVEWLLEGVGPNPLASDAQIPEDIFIQHELKRFQSFYKNAVVLQVPDQHMSPWIKKGDYVGGVVLEEVDKGLEKVCIVKIQGFGTRVRLVQRSSMSKLYNLRSFTDKGNILNVEIEQIAPVIFLRSFQKGERVEEISQPHKDHAQKKLVSQKIESEP